MIRNTLPAVLCTILGACAGEPADLAGSTDDAAGETTSTATANIVTTLPATHTFAVSAGNSVLVRVADIGNTAFWPVVNVYDPAGTRVTWGSGTLVASASFRAATTGTYSAVVSDGVNPPAAIASYALYVAVAPGSSTGGALSPGGMKAGHIDLGEIDSYTFTAATGEGIGLRVTDIAGGALWPEVNVYGPAGNLVTWTNGQNVASVFFAAPSAGTYTVVVYDVSSGWASTGDYNLYFTKAPGANHDGLLSPGGMRAGHIDEGEIDSYTFTAATGEGIGLRVTDIAGGALWPQVYVYGPAGNLVTWTNGADVASVFFAAPSAGTYTVVVYDVSNGSASTGDYNLYFTKAPGANQGGALISGGSVLAHIDEGELDSYTFAALTGDTIGLTVTDLAGGALWPQMNIYGPAGNLVTWVNGQNVASRSLRAPSTGTYTVVVFDVSNGWASTGDYRLDYARTPGP